MAVSAHTRRIAPTCWNQKTECVKVVGGAVELLTREMHAHEVSHEDVASPDGTRESPKSVGEHDSTFHPEQHVLRDVIGTSRGIERMAKPDVS